MPKIQKIQKIHTNYGDYIKDVNCQKFIKQNKQWQENDPIGFIFELLEKFGTNPEKNPTEDIEITPENIDSLFNQKEKENDER